MAPRDNLGKTYFLMRNLDYGPNDRIKLGQIISSPFSPWEIVAPPLEPVPGRHNSLKRNVLHRADKRCHTKVSVWAQFLSTITGIGVDADVDFYREICAAIEINELNTELFDPDDEYVHNVVTNPGSVGKSIRDYIDEHPREPIFMITGIKVAVDARGTVFNGGKAGGGVKIGVDATPFTGMPVNGGPGFHADRAHSTQTAFGGSSDFVFAYRLRRIVVNRHYEIKGSKEYTVGATVLTTPDAIPLLAGVSKEAVGGELCTEVLLDQRDHEPNVQRSKVRFRIVPCEDDGMDEEAGELDEEDEEDFGGDCMVIFMENETETARDQ